MNAKTGIQANPSSSFVDALYRVAWDQDTPGPVGGAARGHLADLRAGANFTPQGRMRLLPALYHCSGGLPPELSGSQCHSASWTVPEIVAALFAMTPEQRMRRRDVVGATLATAFGRLWQARDRNGSLERRFLTLVNTARGTLPGQLRHAIRLLDSSGHEYEFDWYTLPRDLARWGRSDRLVQNIWLRQFYGASLPEGARDDVGVTNGEGATGDYEGDEE